MYSDEDGSLNPWAHWLPSHRQVDVSSSHSHEHMDDVDMTQTQRMTSPQHESYQYDGVGDGVSAGARAEVVVGATSTHVAREEKESSVRTVTHRRRRQPWAHCGYSTVADYMNIKLFAIPARRSINDDVETHIERRGLTVSEWLDEWRVLAALRPTVAQVSCNSYLI